MASPPQPDTSGQPTPTPETKQKSNPKKYVKKVGEILAKPLTLLGGKPFEAEVLYETELKTGMSQLWPAMCAVTEPKKYIAKDSCCGKNTTEECEGEVGKNGFCWRMEDKGEVMVIFRFIEMNEPEGEPGFQKASCVIQTVTKERDPALSEKYGPNKMPFDMTRSVTFQGLGPGKGVKATVRDIMKVGAPYCTLIRMVTRLGCKFADMHKPSLEEFFQDMELRSMDRTRKTVTIDPGAIPTVGAKKRRGSQLDIFLATAVAMG